MDGLVNFEKLRMIAKEIRQVIRMTSANMDPAVMFRQRCAIKKKKKKRIKDGFDTVGRDVGLYVCMNLFYGPLISFLINTYQTETCTKGSCIMVIPLCY